MQERAYQTKIEREVFEAWSLPDIQNVMVVSPTGSGKTVTFSSIIDKHNQRLDTYTEAMFAVNIGNHNGVSCAIAHRQELVGQISLALAKYGIRHNIIAPRNVVNTITRQQIEELGTHFFDSNAKCAVAGVRTINSQKKKLKHFLDKVSLWVMDEAHHILRDNEWGKAIDCMPNAKGLGVTATPIRADGKGLGRHADGVMDVLIQGPTMRELIEDGWLTDYTIYGVLSDFHLTDDDVSKSTGDFNQKKLKKAAQQSHIVGDVVDHYQRIAIGKPTIVFATDVQTATDIANQFTACGIRAEVLSAKTKDSVRVTVIKRFRNGEVDVLVNVDLFGEGFDLPAIIVDQFARPTQSYSLYVQQFGRALRPIYADGFDLTTREGRLAAIAASCKPIAIIIDHAGNVARHGLPDKEREWSLDARGSTPRAKDPDDDIPLRYCPACTKPYEAIYRSCPHCGHYIQPQSRSSVEFVDGDLLELSPEVLAQMRMKVEAIDIPPEVIGNRMKHAGAPQAAINGAMKNFKLRAEMQQALRESMSWWAGYQKHKGHDDSESYRLFYHLFGIDVLNAQALGKPDALALADKINDYLGRTYHD